jgi:hypothetical protein
MYDSVRDWANFLLGYVPPWLVGIVEKWLFRCFYLVFSAVSWLLGGGLWNWILNNALYLAGAYFISRILFDFMAQWVVDSAEIDALSHNPTIQDLMMRARYPPFSRALYDKYKGWKVRQIIVGQHPVAPVVYQIVKTFSLGLWDKIGHTMFYSGRLHHVLLFLVLESPYNEYKMISLDKNEVVGISDNFTINSEMIIRNVPNVKQLDITLEKFLEPAHNQKEKHLKYKIMDNNCQGFTNFLLEAHGILTSELNEFIMQDIKKLSEILPSAAFRICDFVMFISRLWAYVLYVR